MPFDVKGAVAVITGAASGIGAALATALARRGCHLALADLDKPGLERVAASVRTPGVTVSTHRLDVSDAGGIAALPAAVLASHGRVNLLVNNAGVALGGKFEDVPEAEFDWLMAVNFQGTVRMTRTFLPLLRRESAAHIVNVSSLFGLIAPSGQVAYAASKFAVRGFSEALRHELAKTAITITVVHPGGIRTNIAANAKFHGALTNMQAETIAKTWDRLLKLSPDTAAAAILRAIERRQKRLLIGTDAKQADLIQRLFPANYWRIMQRPVK